MSTASIPNASSSSARIASDHGSAPKIPTRSDVDVGSMPWLRNSSAITRAYDGVAHSTSASKSTSSCT